MAKRRFLKATSIRLRDHDGGPFLHGLLLPPHYPIAGGHKPLHKVSLPSFAKSGSASNLGSLDSGSRQTVWHRLYLEASIPARCGIRVWLAASEEGGAPLDPAEWHEHRFGSQSAWEEPPAIAGVPYGAWCSYASELPHHPGLLHCPVEKDRAGLFTALVQRPGLAVRSLRGRYLWVRVELFGDGRATPGISALRAYGSRFSYADRYLPEFYRETVFAPEADVTAKATPADFLERFLGIFEGVLTPLEDRIADSWLLTDPRTAPHEALEWVGSWVGMSFDPVVPQDRWREMLERAPDLYRARGTLRGLQLALDLATDGGVSSGAIIVLENYRLKRTFATILGADLSDDKDPLLGGLAVSGNSYVGDTLILGDEQKKEFLSLFNAETLSQFSAAEQTQVDEFLERLSNRVTVLVHQEVNPQDLGVIRKVVELESPAHVDTKVLTASFPFLVAVASLVGVDTYLARKPVRGPVRLGYSGLGVRDYLVNPGSIDPRLYRTEQAASGKPLARFTVDPKVPFGQGFRLDAGD